MRARPPYGGERTSVERYLWQSPRRRTFRGQPSVTAVDVPSCALLDGASLVAKRFRHSMGRAQWSNRAHTRDCRSRLGRRWCARDCLEPPCLDILMRQFCQLVRQGVPSSIRSPPCYWHGVGRLASVASRSAPADKVRGALRRPERGGRSQFRPEMRAHCSGLGETLCLRRRCLRGS